MASLTAIKPGIQMSLFVALLCSTPVLAGDGLETLVGDGPTLQLQANSEGVWQQATVTAMIDAPVDKVWSTLVNFDDYVYWMPAVVTVSVDEASTDTETLITWGMQTPGPNIAYTTKTTVDADAKTLTRAWESGALEGSHWKWTLTESTDGKTLVQRVSDVRLARDHWLVRQFDDEWSTLGIGLNAATPMLEVKALQERVKKR